MKKTCLIILVIALIGITTITIYTLANQEIKGTQEIKKTKSIEKASSNLTENELNEIYNVQLNGKRHRLKSNYRVVLEDKFAKITLTLYLDGFEIHTQDIMTNLDLKEIEKNFQDQINNFETISEENIKIIKTDQDYLAVSITSNIENLKEEYFIWTSSGDNLLKNVVIYDEGTKYVSTTEEALDIFYDDEKEIMAKIEDNEIYAIERAEADDTIVLEEKVYTLKKGKVEEKKLNTYENIAVASETEE